MIVIDVFPVIAVATVGHQTTYAQDNHTTARWANCPRGCCLRRCNDAAARRYCCLHRLFSCLSRARITPAPFAPARHIKLNPGHRRSLQVGTFNKRGSKTARVLTLANYSVVGTTLGNPSKWYYSTNRYVWQRNALSKLAKRGAQIWRGPPVTPTIGIRSLGSCP